MANTLAAPADLADFPGAPFSAALVDAAAGSVRGEVGWHIAPAVTETVTVVSEGGTVLLVPSLRVTAVTEVRDVSGDTPEVLMDWVFRRSGILERAYGWPKRHAIEVDLTHGYAETPPELLPVIADTARTLQRGGRVTQESLGSRSVSMASGNPASAVLARFTIPQRP
jgi:hypothetical protein